MNYNEWTVAELKKECKERGIPVSTHGHKFTKAELIEQLNQIDVWDEDNDETENVSSDEAVDSVENGYYKNVFAETQDEIVEKYDVVKPDWVYDSVLDVGSTVVFLHYFETRAGVLVKKLRRAKVSSVDRDNKEVTVSLKYSGELYIGFEDLIYIASKEERFPKDIATYFRKHKSIRWRDREGGEYSDTSTKR